MAHQLADFSRKEKVLTGFNQHDSNVQKAGAYYTDTSHALRLGRFFYAPEEQSIILDPSIGDGSAMTEFIKGMDATDNFVKYGVDIRKNVVDELIKSAEYKTVVEADFVNGTIITNGAFPIVFSNPPYDTIQTDSGPKRLEYMFLQSLVFKLTRNGYLVWIVPQACVADTLHTRYMLNHFQVLKAYKFDEAEFKKYHQYVFILRKKITENTKTEEVEDFISKLDSLGHIPDVPDIRYHIPAYTANSLKHFQSKLYHPEYDFDNMLAVGEFKITPAPYKPINITHMPPIPIKQQSEALIIASGGCYGLQGCEGQKHILSGKICDSEQESVSQVVTDNEAHDIVKVTQKKVIKLNILLEQTKNEDGSISPAELVSLA